MPRTKSCGAFFFRKLQCRACVRGFPVLPSTAMNSENEKAQPSSLRAVCIARHPFLSEHIARYFRELGVATTEAVGLSKAQAVADMARPDVVICDYDILATMPLYRWEQHSLLSSTPVVAVSLTRKCEDLHLLDMDGIAGFLYLPTLQPAQALQIIRAAATRPKYSLPPIDAPRVVEHS
jgi:CheY-like chemotaxis protein